MIAAEHDVVGAKGALDVLDRDKWLQCRKEFYLEEHGLALNVVGGEVESCARTCAFLKLVRHDPEFDLGELIELVLKLGNRVGEALCVGPVNEDVDCLARDDLDPVLEGQGQAGEP